MSDARLPRELTSLGLSLLGCMLGWLLIAPWAALMPRRRDRIAVIGRDEGKFVDNAKYFHLQGTALLAPKVRLVFVTERRDVADMLDDTGCETLLYPTPRAIWHLVRAGTVVVDSIEWTRHARRFLVVGAKRLQLWHGVGFKRIELDKWSHEVVTRRRLSMPVILALRKAMHLFTGRLVRYDAVNCTSAFYRDNVFSPAFLARRFPITGYPRNTFGQLSGPAGVLAWRNVDAAIRKRMAEWQAEHRRIVLVAPTFRDSRATPMGLTSELVDMLDRYCEQQAIELVFKFHPSERGAGQVKGRHLHLCDPASDLYPLMPASSALITDYSSVYMDYLLLDKPVLFLVPDLQQYVAQDRQLQFDFADMSPGPKLSSWDQVMGELINQWEHDGYVKDRARLRQVAFDDLPQNEAVPRLIAFMREEGWLPLQTEVFE